MRSVAEHQKLRAKEIDEESKYRGKEKTDKRRVIRRGSEDIQCRENTHVARKSSNLDAKIGAEATPELNGTVKGP